MTATIGIDFDNTIVSYDELMYRAARARQLIDGSTERSKRAIRDAVRRLNDGEVEWQKLQALVYGPLMRDARTTDGAGEFIRWCRDAGMDVFIISHKTEYAGYDETSTNLRTAALDWMAAHRFFDTDGLALSRSAVYFESTRLDKIARIASTRCSYFIDDLEEVFLEPSFPSNVQKILYSPGAQAEANCSAIVMQSWRALRDYLVDRRA